MAETPPAPLMGALGGEAGIRAWVDRFYDAIAAHALLAPLFPPDLSPSRDKQFAFFVQFFGGPPLYEQRYGKAFLRFKHRHVRIGAPERDAWMELLLSALRDGGAAADLVDQVEARVAPLANAMINHHPEKQDAYFFN
ncbi:MAG: globin [Candidatus Lambdaproteobacteria bacterium]|nr:globin [Candidatus Lambdaproteobacteria bacterium]